VYALMAFKAFQKKIGKDSYFPACSITEKFGKT
jgi:hypothetical protein